MCHMWYALSTELHHEEEARQLLTATEGVRDVYLPLCRRTTRSANGQERHSFRPTISGVLFAYVDDKDLPPMLSEWGYLAKGIRLLRTAETPHSTSNLIAQARIPNRDIDRLRLYNDRLVEGMEELQILNTDFRLLEMENDTVAIVDGPLKGFEGIIKQVTTHGRKDRHLLFRVGDWTVRIPGVRSHRHIVVREAKQGNRVCHVNAWRHIDLLIGRLQAEIDADEAPRLLRTVLLGLNRGTQLADYITTLPDDEPLKHFLCGLSTPEEAALLSLSHYFQSYDQSILAALADLLPDHRLRPFLTPTSGKEIPDGQDYTTLAHKEFTELILRLDLRPHFRRMVFTDGSFQLTDATNQPAEDFTYYAHIALLPNADGSVTALVGWNGFQRQYALLTDAERETFHANLLKFGYSHLHDLLTKSNDTQFTRLVPDLAGFTLQSGFDPTEVELLALARHLTDLTAPAAVELWQGTRMLTWRQLLQRHVLLHKQPVREEETPTQP